MKFGDTGRPAGILGDADGGRLAVSAVMTALSGESQLFLEVMAELADDPVAVASLVLLAGRLSLSQRLGDEALQMLALEHEATIGRRP